MRSFIVFEVVTLIAASVVFLALMPAEPIAAQSPALAAVQAWEYRSLQFAYPGLEGDKLKAVNDLGAEGWELVTAIQTDMNNYGYLYFKRPKQEP
jgi:hypothetical protein